MVVLLMLISGLGLLTIGAEGLIRGASGVARAFGLSALVIGLTIAAYGTSTPELIVSFNATLANQPDIAIGNIVGSNIFNVLLILGACALVSPLIVASKLIKIDVPIMIGVSFLLWLMALDGNINQFEGILLLLGIIAYTVFCINSGKIETSEVKAEYDHEFGGDVKKARQWQSILLNVVFIAVGLLALGFGSKLFVQAAIEIARMLGLSERIIGLTIVAAGTSLPEVATSIVATIKGERDIAIGNVVGSNIYNILAILGVVATMSNRGVSVASGMVGFDIPIMCLVAVLCFPVFYTAGKISRKEGLLFLVMYVAYVAYLIMKT